MRTFHHLAVAALALGATLSTPADAAVVYDESISGDLSDSGLAPTVLNFALGSNEVIGTSGDPGDAFRDYFTFTVQPGQALASIEVLPGTAPIGAVAFIALESGVQVTVAPDAGSAAGLLGWWHYGLGDVDTDILDDMSVPEAGSSGFSIPLGPGAYSVWIQEGNLGTSPYAFAFELSEVDVPEPGSLAVVLVGLGLGWHLRRRARQRSLPG